MGGQASRPCVVARVLNLIADPRDFGRRDSQIYLLVSICQSPTAILRSAISMQPETLHSQKLRCAFDEYMAMENLAGIFNRLT